MEKKIDYNPYTNHNAICVIKQEDGNWVGYMHKNGKDIEVRQSDPLIVIQMLLTHP